MNVTFNVYIGVPLMQMEFGEWLHAPRAIRVLPPALPSNSPIISYINYPLQYLYKYFEDGFPVVLQYTAVILYVSLNITFGILKSR